MTETTHASYVTEVRGDTAHQIRNDLNSAVDRAIGRAIEIGSHGVLVTQHSYTFHTSPSAITSLTARSRNGA